MSSLTNSDWIAISSAVVALCALAVSLWQGYLARRHSFLSVKPHIDVIVDVSTTGTNDITLQNGGLGPAVIEGLELTLNGMTIRVRSDKDYLPLVDILRAAAPDSFFSHALPDSSSIISPNDSLLIFRARSPAHQGQLFEAFNSLTDQACIRVQYKCLYGIKYESEYKPSQHVA